MRGNAAGVLCSRSRSSKVPLHSWHTAGAAACGTDPPSSPTRCTRRCSHRPRLSEPAKTTNQQPESERIGQKPAAVSSSGGVTKQLPHACSRTVHSAPTQQLNSKQASMQQRTLVCCVSTLQHPSLTKPCGLLPPTAFIPLPHPALPRRFLHAPASEGLLTKHQQCLSQGAVHMHADWQKK